MKIPGLGLVADPADLAWRETRTPGVSWIPLHTAEEKGAGARRGRATVLIRMEPGRAYTPHRHLDGEEVLVLLGGYEDELGQHVQGDYVHYPPGSRHAPRALGEAARPTSAENPPCILFASVPGGIELLQGTDT